MSILIMSGMSGFLRRGQNGGNMKSIDQLNMAIQHKVHVESKISLSEIEYMVEMALRAPSGDNCQPWSFSWKNQVLAISYNSKLGAHALNNNNHATWLTLGCLYETLVISATGLNLHVDATFDFENWNTGPVAILRLTRRPIQTDPLIAEIKRRRTTRLPYSKTKIRENVLAQMHVEARKFTNCKLSIKQTLPTQIMEYLYFCDAFMWKNMQVVKDFFKLVHLNQLKETHVTNGMPWQTLGINKLDLLPMRILKRFPSMIRILWKLGFSLKIKGLTQSLMSSQGGLYCLSIEGSGAAHVTEAGRLAYRLWLILGSEGYCVQPVSIASMTGFDVATGHPPPQTNAESIEKFKIGYKMLKAFFSLTDSAQPVWMFRAGQTNVPVFIPPVPRPSVHERLKVG